MKRPGNLKSTALGISALAAASLCAQPSASVNLFNGVTLEQWKSLGNGSWSVKDGAIVGRQSPSNPGFAHLAHDTVVKDFRLTFLFKSTRGNAGFFFRLHPVPGNPDSVAGAQVVIDPDLANDNAFGLYETGGRQWLRKWDYGRHSLQYPSPGNSCMLTRDWPELPFPDSICRKSLYKPGEWNRVSVWAKGPRIIVKLNMRTIADLSDAALDRPGRFAFKMHGGKDVEIRFKDVELSEPFALPSGIRSKLKKALLYKGEAASPPPLREYMKEIAAENGIILEEGTETAFTRQNLAQYQAALFLSDYNVNFSAAQKTDFEEWFKGGRGSVCLHACTRYNIVLNWPWWGQAMGASLQGHGVYKSRSLAMDAEAGSRPLWAKIDARTQTWADEWYYWRSTPRGKPGVTVLLSMADEGDAGSPVVKGYPSAWLSNREGGRFFVWGAPHTMNSLELPFTYDFLLNGMLEAAGYDSLVTGMRPSRTAGGRAPQVIRQGDLLRFRSASAFTVHIRDLSGRSVFSAVDREPGELVYRMRAGMGILLLDIRSDEGSIKGKLLPAEALR